MRLQGQAGRKAKQEVMSFERRTAPRVTVARKTPVVLFFEGRRFLGRVADISQGGVRISMSELACRRLSALVRIESRVDLIINSEDIALQCEVRHFDGGSVGLQFVDSISRARTLELLARLTE